MEKLSLFAFNLRAFFQALLCVIIRIFSVKVAKRYLNHIDKVDEKFGIKAIRKGWGSILCLKMRYFVQLPGFRRELILSKLPDEYILDMLRSIKLAQLSTDDFVMIALNRSFKETGTANLNWFKRALFGLTIENKKEIIKYFYKNSGEGESSDLISELLLEDFEDDFEFIFWHVLNGGSNTIRKFFIKKLVSGIANDKTKEQIKLFAENTGLGGCEFEKKSYSELLLGVRPFLTRKEDIEIWEHYLLKGKNIEIIKPQVRKFGIQSKKGLDMLLELNNKDIIDAYNYQKSAKLRLS